MKEVIFQYKNAPVLKPIPIPTKEGNWFHRIKGWFTTRKWEVDKDFYFSINNLPCIIPKGFVFDGASVPRLFWFILHPTGILMIPGLIHDYGYKHQHLIGFTKNDEGEPILTKFFTFTDRKRWDMLFTMIAIAVNCFKGINYIAYLGIRSGGWLAWKGHRKNDS